LHLFGQESVWSTCAIANINLVLHELEGTIKYGDTLKDPKYTDGNKVEQFDMVAANFPFSDENWWKNGTLKKNKKGKSILKKDGSPQFQYPKKDSFVDPYDRFVYGIPDFSKGDFAFIQHIIASLNDKGRAGVVCPQGVLFRGQPQKTEEEDGQNRKADDEYLIRRAFLEGLESEQKEIIEAIVVLPKNIFYGTSIPGSIVFFNKNKPEDKKGKVLMVYAAWEGWCKEEPDLNILRPHDVMRIIVQLEAWGDIEKAKESIPKHEKRLNDMAEENLQFRIGEIELEFEEEQQKFEETEEALKDNSINGGKRKYLEKIKKSLQKELNKKNEQIKDVNEQAEKEREEIQHVKNELLEMFVNPEIRKKYFSVVDIEEIKENEFNLNIPRYVDTFLPEEEIDLQEAIKEFNEELKKEKEIDEELKNILKVFAK
jgi:type I restriction enzyme M protein